MRKRENGLFLSLLAEFLRRLFAGQLELTAQIFESAFQLAVFEVLVFLLLGIFHLRFTIGNVRPVLQTVAEL